MNKFNFLCCGLTAGLFISAQVIASEPVSDCSTPLFKRLEVVEKTEHRLPIRAPDATLALFMRRYEISCPWRVEADLNGDNMQDWAGVVGDKGKYSLIVYLSDKGHYKIVQIEKFDKFPKSTYLTLISAKEAMLIGKKNFSSSRIKQLLQVNQLNKNSTIYQWQDKRFKVYARYQNPDTMHIPADAEGIGPGNDY